MTSHEIQNFHEDLHLLLGSVKNGKRGALTRKFGTLAVKTLLRGSASCLDDFYHNAWNTFLLFFCFVFLADASDWWNAAVASRLLLYLMKNNGF